jgi:hypothetical protein
MFELDQNIVDILFDANAEEYIPFFKRQRVALEHFLEMTDAQLKPVRLRIQHHHSSLHWHLT